MSLARQVVEALSARKMTIATVESCTGGFLAAALTCVEGASEVFEYGYVTYSNDAKCHLGVPAKVIYDHGVYSRECVESMAHTGAFHAGADVCVAVSGSLGRKDPANPDSKVGEVHVFVLRKGAAPDYRQLQVDVEERALAKKHVAEQVFRLVLDGLPTC